MFTVQKTVSIGKWDHVILLQNNESDFKDNGYYRKSRKIVVIKC